MGARLFRLPVALLPAILLAATLAGCAGQAPRPGPFPAQQVPPAKQLSQTPFYPQDAYQCGPAALAMILTSLGLDASPEALRDKVYLPGREGSLQVEMVAAARSHELLVYPLEQELDAIILEVAAGNPVLVMQNLRFDWWPQWHFAVVTGYDLAERELILNSGLEEGKRTAFRTFDNTWARGDRWARVILPPDRLPATAEPLAYVRAAYDLEQTRQSAAAAQAYRTATRTWPDNLAARFARANLALSESDTDQAREQFGQLVAQHPGYAPGWHNFALSLQQSGCARAAEEAQACARTLAPEDSRFQDNPGATSAPEHREPARCGVPACAIPSLD